MSLDDLCDCEQNVTYLSTAYLHISGQPALLNLKWFYGPFGQSNTHSALNFCPDQPGINQMYQSKRVAKILLSNLPL